MHGGRGAPSRAGGRESGGRISNEGGRGRGGKICAIILDILEPYCF